MNTGTVLCVSGRGDPRGWAHGRGDRLLLLFPAAHDVIPPVVQNQVAASSFPKA